MTTGSARRGVPLSNQDAWEVYDGFLMDSRVRMFPELPVLEDHFRVWSTVPQPSPKIWVDAYLAALAMANQATLVTFDHAFTNYAVEHRILR
jgi:predicted nucleic acid-binding protein